MDVELVRFPAESERLAGLRASAVPRLLLVEGDVDPPALADDAEDWIRVPADPRDLQARLSGLAQRTAAAQAGEPVLDGDGVLRNAGRWVSLPPVEARLARALLDRYGAVVSRTTLVARGWPDDAPGRNALDVHVLRLRRRLATVGLAIRTVRSRGYLMEPVSERRAAADPVVS
ncbi:MAG TPA: winged helix-turn-helix domain-containing protein [Acidimicrobiales bacterium]|jgi:DNA-binding response OmpR family regulator|nr:winged helix-turn-helix domain-containing protein [Acidimicrobiales bacterium]